MERTLYGRNMSVLLRSTERVFQAFQGCSETGPADCHFLPQLVEIKMNKRQLSRRHFTLCAAVGLSLPIVPAASVVAADAPPRTVKLRNAAIVRRSARVLHVWAKDDIPKRLSKKHYVQAYRSG